MTASFLLIAQSGFTVTNSVYSGAVERPPNVQLAWDDEFDGASIDPQYGTHKNKQGWINGERQYYQRERVNLQRRKPPVRVLDIAPALRDLAMIFLGDFLNEGVVFSFGFRSADGSMPAFTSSRGRRTFSRACARVSDGGARQKRPCAPLSSPIGLLAPGPVSRAVPLS